MNISTQKYDTDRHPRGLLCSLSVEELAHLAILRMGCEGFDNRVFELGVTAVESFGCLLLTPGGLKCTPHKHLVTQHGIKIDNSTVYRFIETFRSSARSIMSEYIRAAATDRGKPVLFPRDVEIDRAVDPKDVKTR